MEDRRWWAYRQIPGQLRLKIRADPDNSRKSDEEEHRPPARKTHLDAPNYRKSANRAA
jgi:hypothetical protein